MQTQVNTHLLVVHFFIFTPVQLLQFVCLVLAHGDLLFDASLLELVESDEAGCLRIYVGQLPV